MNSFLRSLAIGCAATLFAVAVRAAEVSPSGKWTWTAIGRSGPSSASAIFEVRDGKIVGSVTVTRGKFPIKGGRFKDGEVSFQTEVPVEHETVVSEYRGQFTGDTIKGTIRRSGRDGGPAITVDWYASRVN